MGQPRERDTLMSTADTYGFWLGSFFHNEKLPAFALLAGLVLTFLGLRVNTRLIRKGVSWWPGDIHRGKVHVHHVVIGLPVMFVIGVVEFAVHPGSPWVELLALFFT
jgi:lysyl-tRNA synthetase class 2